jgi:LacI family xylobiose transport system transcriptional regulator
MNEPKLRIGVVFAPDAPIFSPDKTSSDPEDVYFGPLLRGFRKAADDFDVILIYTRQEPAGYLDFTRDEAVDGLVLLTFGLADFPMYSDLRSSAIPFVIVGVSTPEGEAAKLPCVDASNIEGGRMAARYLLDLGHRDLGCINLAGGFANHSDRMYGFIDEIKASGVPVDYDHILVDDGYVWPLFEERIAEWLSGLKTRGALPTAIFACDFIMAEALYAAMKRVGAGIPDEVSVIGFDDPPPGRIVTPALTTVRQPIEAIAARAIERLVDSLREEAPGSARRQQPKPIVGNLILPTELIVRKSTSPPRA